MTIAVDPSETKSATPATDADLKAKIADSLRKRNAEMAAAAARRPATPATHAAPAQPQPAAPVAVAPRPARDPAAEAALRRSYMKDAPYDGRLPSWSKVTFQQNLAGLAMFAAILAGLWFFYGVNVNRDLMLSGSFKSDRSIQVQKGSCSRYMFLVSACSANLIDRSAGAESAQTASYLVMFRNMGGQPLIPVRSVKDRSVVSVRLATDDTLTNRAATLYGITAFGVLVCLIFIRRLSTGRYADGPALAAYS